MQPVFSASRQAPAAPAGPIGSHRKPAREARTDCHVHIPQQTASRPALSTSDKKEARSTRPGNLLVVGHFVRNSNPHSWSPKQNQTSRDNHPTPKRNYYFIHFKKYAFIKSPCRKTCLCEVQVSANYLSFCNVLYIGTLCGFLLKGDLPTVSTSQ